MVARAVVLQGLLPNKAARDTSKHRGFRAASELEAYVANGECPYPSYYS